MALLILSRYLLRKKLQGAKIIVKEIFSYAEILLACFLLTVLIRYFVIDIYTVPTGSMKNTLLPGDRIVVNKIIYGFRKYNTRQKKYVRLKGYAPIKRRDVFIFNHPGSDIPSTTPLPQRTVLVKRCIGLPGDTLRLRNKQIFINKALIDSIRYDSLLENFPESKPFKWIKGDFDNLIIPYQGCTIKLDSNNIALYQELIVQHEKNKLEIRLGNSYTFSNDYYFALGDNRKYSHDSRHWGFVPKSHIIGKFWFILRFR